MIKDYKIFFLIILVVLSFGFLAGFQISIINSLALKFNIFLFLTLILIFLKKYYSAILFAWFSGFLIDTVHFSIFGITSLVLLLLSTILIIFQKKALLMAKTESILIISLIAVFLYHFLEWIINSASSLGQERLILYFLNGGIIIEYFITTVLLFITLKCLKTTI